jgi:hypothetical protein
LLPCCTHQLPPPTHPAWGAAAAAAGAAWHESEMKARHTAVQQLQHKCSGAVTVDLPLLTNDGLPQPGTLQGQGYQPRCCWYTRCWMHLVRQPPPPPLPCTP